MPSNATAARHVGLARYGCGIDIAGRETDLGGLVPSSVQAGPELHTWGHGFQVGT